MWAKDIAEALLPNAEFPPGVTVAKVQAAASTVWKRYDRHRKKGAPPATAPPTDCDDPFVASPASPAIPVTPARSASSASAASPACTCPKCGRTFKTAQGLVGHLPTCNPPSPDGKGDASVKCPKCDKVFKTPEGLTGHLPSCNPKIPEPKGDAEVQCPKCDKVFKTPEGLTGHLQTCNPKSPHDPQPSGRPKKAQEIDMKSSVGAWVVTSARNNFLSTLMRLVDCHRVMQVIFLFAPFVFAQLSVTCRRVHSALKDYAARVPEEVDVDDDDGDDGDWMFGLDSG